MSPGAAVIFGAGLVILTVAAVVCVCSVVALFLDGDLAEMLGFLVLASILITAVYFGVNAYAAAWGWA